MTSRISLGPTVEQQDRAHERLKNLADKMEVARRAKSEAALDIMVRVNGALPLVSRRALVERLVGYGYRVTLRKNGERVLMSPTGSWFDTKNITKAGLDYAERITPHDRGTAY